MTFPAKLIDVQQYLNDTIEAIDPSFQMTVSDSHRKGMMSALMGISKVKMDEDLRNLSSKLRWDKAERFVQEALIGMAPPEEAAPQFRIGVEKYKSFAPNVAKLFSYLARGRRYKGQFEQLLQDVRPDLSPIFRQVVDPISHEELYSEYALLEQDPALQELLLKCAKKQLTPAPQDSSNGKSKGAKSEASLQEFLADICNTDNRVLKNTFITTKSKDAISKKCSHVIQISKSLDLNGMTTELDAVVLAPLKRGDDTAIIEEVWEAKATLHAVTLHDALSKKFSAVSTIFSQDDAKLYIEGEEYKIQLNDFPSVGVFGSKILSPTAAARRSQVLTCERMLSSSPEAVEEALATGKITVCHQQLIKDLTATLRLAEEVKPKVVVPLLLD